MQRNIFRPQIALPLLAAALTGAGPVFAQSRGAPQLDQLVRGLATSARVLVIGAHPDDEDTQAIAWLARGKHVETAYLSLTRGDGGQNLIGNELGESLGAIRTEELLAARRVDGGRQYFTRAFDFGFSKNADETAKHWPRDSVLGDIVTVIRAFRPHVIYTIWSGTRADGHGHHETAGLLAREAFEVAADTVRFPVKLHGEPWSPAKLYGRGVAIPFPVNDYDPVLGRTYAEIAMDSRSQHRSQGFAQFALRAPVPGSGGRGFPFGGAVVRIATHVNATVDSSAEKSIFDGIDTTFARLLVGAPDSARALLSAVPRQADSAVRALDFHEPWRVAPIVARMTSAIQEVRGRLSRCVLRRGPYLRRADTSVPPRCTAAELDLDAALETLERRGAEAVLASAELSVEASVPRELLAFGDSLPATVSIVNHGSQIVTIRGVRFTGGPRGAFRGAIVRPDSGVAITQNVVGFPDGGPWWLGGRDGDLFQRRMSAIDGIARVSAIADQLVPAVSIPEDGRRMTEAWLTLDIAGATVVVPVGPLVYRTADPLLGVQDRPLVGVPEVTLDFDRNIEWVPASKPIDRILRLTVRSFADSPRSFSLTVVAPKGLKVDSLPAQLTMAPHEVREVFLRLRGTLSQGRFEFGVVGELPKGVKFAEGFMSVVYPHIRPIYKYRTSGLYIQSVNIELPPRLTVAYIQGVGDDNAVYLRQLGVQVTTIQPAEVAQWDLSRFSTVVIGTRAFDASGALLAYSGRLLDFAKNGGTLVMQYGQNVGSMPQVFPFPMTWTAPADRVTEEKAPVKVVDAKSRLLNYPNLIGPADWDEWVQERALYMPHTIDPRYQTPLEMHDPNEPENRGAIVSTAYGKGMFVFTSLALFRQLPNAVPGSPRIFVNILSAGVQPSARPTP